MRPGRGRHRREVHDRLDSTQAEALRRAGAEPGPLWIVARTQTAGRGRRGRPWAGDPGNLAATLLMTPPGGLALAALRSFVAALALRDALVELTGAPGLFHLKWPNDVLLEGRKVAGILLETAGPPLRLAIGFGVNLAASPDPAALEDTAMTPTSVSAATGAAIHPDAFLDRLAPAFDRWEARLRAGGFAPVRAAWLGHAAGLGRPLVARLPGRTLHGRFETIDATGALVLATAAGPVTLPAADVHLAGEPSDPPAPPGPGQPPGQPPRPDQPPVEPPGPDQPPIDPEPGDPDRPPEPDTPEGPDVPVEDPPVVDPRGPDVPVEHPQVEDPPGADVPGEIPPPVPTDLPPAGPAEIPLQARRAAGD